MQKSISEKFLELHNKGWSTFTSFAQAVDGGGYSPKQIEKFFDLLVDKNDYKPRERGAILEYLFEISKGD